MMRLVLAHGDVALIPAVAYYRSGHIRRVLVRWPLLKSQGVLFDEKGAYRWITVHPHGPDEPGQPVKIRESKTHPGTWHVVAGAGGKLNYLKLTRLKSPEEYKREALAKRAARKAREKMEREAERARLESLTPEEREAERARKRSEERERAARELALTVQKQEFVSNVANLLGWKPEEWQFADTRARLRAAGASDERIEQLERAHWRHMYRRALDVAAEAKRRLILDHEARAASGLGEVQLKSDDPNVVALSDLDPDRLGSGLGYRRDIAGRSDAEITKQLAMRDVDALRSEIAELESLDSDSLATHGEIIHKRAELRAAELLAKTADKTPEELSERAQELERLIGETLEERAKVQADIDVTERELTEEEVQRIHTLDERLDTLRDELEAVGIMQGEARPVVRAEQRALVLKRREAREQELMLADGPEAAAAYRMRVEALEQGLKRYRAEVAYLRQVGALKKPEVEVRAPDDPKTLLEVVRHAKAIKAYERKLADDKEPAPDDRLYGKGYFVETRRAAIDEAVERDIQEAIRERLTTSFLREVEKAQEDPNLLELSETERRASLERHLSAGAYNAMNTAALHMFGQPMVSRDVADVLGAAGTAQLLAYAAHTLKPDEVSVLAEAVGKYHAQRQKQQAEEASREAQALYEQVKEIELGAAANPADLAVMQEINQKRRERLLAAREILGTTLGGLEAYGALALALKAKKPEEIHVNLGPVGAESAIRQVRGIGLDRGDYTIDSDGVNQFLTIHASGLAKLIRPVDLEEFRVNEEVAAIKRGERDEPNWVPPGLVSRPATRFSDPDVQPPLSLGRHQELQRPFERWGERDVREDVEDYIGARIADGDDPNDILPDILTELRRVPEGERGKVVDVLDDLIPAQVPLTDRDGKPVYRRDKQGNVLRDENGEPIRQMKLVKADYHREALQRLAERYVGKYFAADPKVAAFHAQSLKIHTPEDAAKTVEAMHFAVAADPRVVVAFKELGELTPQEQAALRHYYQTEIAKRDPKTGFDGASVAKALADLGPEPPKQSTGLFGEQTNPQWAEWNQRRQAILAQAQESTTGWDEYVRHMGSVRRAYEALQDRLKHDFIDRFRKSYASVHGEALRVGKRSIRNAERHLAFIDPAERERLAEEERKMIDAARNRLRGKYAPGAVKEKVDRMLQMQEIERQNQMSMFGRAANRTLETRPHERLALGEVAENQLRAYMGQVARNFSYALTRPIAMIPNFRMSGKAKISGTEVDLTNQQRTVKAFLARKRLGAFLGVGSGKTPIAIGSFAAAASDPRTQVKRGLFVVRSNNLGQFHGEFARFLDPAKFRWYANPGASQAERDAVHRDPETHVVAVTHEGFRDDMLRLIAEHKGLDRDKAAEWFMGLTRRERAKELREAWDKAGIDYQATFLDEGHVTLDRRGKPDSLLSAMMTAVSDNTPYYMAMTADPMKNDISEIRSQLSKLYPDGRYDDEDAWHKRYGLNTTASREALKQEVANSFFISHIKPPVEAQRRQETVELTPWQKSEQERVMRAFGRLRSDLAAGKINVQAAKELSPESFANLPESEHEQMARRIADAMGTIKEAALHRVINMAPAEQNAKMQRIRELLKADDPRQKPTVIFARNPSVVEELAQVLRADGHRVTTFHGGHSTKEKDIRRREFEPDKGAEPASDVLILSDAGATGLNLQRGQRLIQYDVPLTAMTHNQRQGRIYRLGQTRDVELIDLVSNTDFENRALQRVQHKYDIGSIFRTDLMGGLDENSLGWQIAQERKRREQLEASRAVRLAA